MDSQWIFTIGDRAKDAERMMEAMGVPSFKQGERTMKCGHDGGSYQASRIGTDIQVLRSEGTYSVSRGNPSVSRNVIGHAPGMPQMSAAHDEGRCEGPGFFKAQATGEPITPTNPIPGSEWGFNPKEAETVSKPNGEYIPEIAAEIVASESPRKSGFNYGVGWGPTSKPPIYFDGVRIGNALADIAHDASRKSWAMTIALRNVRLAETDTEKAQAVTELRSLVVDHMVAEDNGDLYLRMLVNDLANTIEEKAPSNPKGYVPHMGIHYAMAPIKAIVAKIKAALSIPALVDGPHNSKLDPYRDYRAD